MNKSKLFNRACSVLMLLITLLLTIELLFTIFVYKNLNGKKDIFGYRVFNINNNIAETNEYKKGDLIVGKKVDEKDIKIDDYIVTISEEKEEYGEYIIRKIGKININNDQSIFNTYDYSTNLEDEKFLRNSDILCKYLFTIKNLGLLSELYKNKFVYYILVILPSIALIAFLIYKVKSLFIIYIKKQNEISSKLKKEKNSIKIENRLIDKKRIWKKTVEQQNMPIEEENYQ